MSRFSPEPGHNVQDPTAAFEQFLEAVWMFVDEADLEEPLARSGACVYLMGAAEQIQRRLADHAHTGPSLTRALARELHVCPDHGSGLTHAPGGTRTDSIAREARAAGVRDADLWLDALDNNVSLRLAQLIKEWRETARTRVEAAAPTPEEP